MAAEDSAALAELRKAVHAGEVEIVGATYAQPYLLFHHGESAIRQLTYGVRAVHRLLGVRPRTFWEEEFAFFPQLPQMLVHAGYEYASLFFQWTWHTPHVPSEELPAIWWEGARRHPDPDLAPRPAQPAPVAGRLRRPPVPPAPAHLPRPGDPAVVGAAALSGLDVPLRTPGRWGAGTARHPRHRVDVRHRVGGAGRDPGACRSPALHHGRRLPRHEPGQERRPGPPTQPGGGADPAVRGDGVGDGRPVRPPLPALGRLSGVGTGGGVAGAARLPTPRQR